MNHILVCYTLIMWLESLLQTTTQRCVTAFNTVVCWR